jgi:hypothetical protein
MFYLENLLIELFVFSKCLLALFFVISDKVRVEFQASEVLIEDDKIEILFTSLAIEEHNSAVVRLVGKILFGCIDFQFVSFLESEFNQRIVPRVNPRVKATENVIEQF